MCIRDRYQRRVHGVIKINYQFKTHYTEVSLNTMADQQNNDIIEALKPRGIDNLCQEQIDQIKKADQYLAKHKIEIIFNELLANIIHVQPDNVQDTIVNSLKQRKIINQTYFEECDFEAFFENYNFLNQQRISVLFLIQALQMVGVQMTQENLIQKYVSLAKDNLVDKKSFVEILSKEYKQRVL
eukprot:TRINITY_DN11109_c0_g1_i3.p1 TRINITY_DN11109_c0_g1~~TRINITY_DN11109_c0_g1_i3.p1  ORF type:complete len:184 (-),score=33.24 TRINITY_DN11109_c0_g1_i3:123-674(-)